MNEKGFSQEVFRIAIPVALQSMLQSSFSMIDQVMVGQLGERAIAAVEIAGKPGFIYAFVIGAIGAIAGIMISQYIGKKDRPAEEKSVCINFLVMILTGVIFFVLAAGFSMPFVKLFSEDAEVIQDGSSYLRIIGWAFVPLGVSNILGVAIRCRGRSSWPLYVGLVSALVNTGLNYCLIFGHLGLPALGMNGAAYASVISQAAGAILTIVLFLRLYAGIRFSIDLGRDGYLQYFAMLCPVVVNEFLWAVGQSVNIYVYGHMGTDELAGMSLTGSVQGLTIGALSGLSQAADDVRRIGAQILLAFAILMPVKVQNMILGGGIIRSGGRTKYIMMIDVFGTWLIGVPLALVCGLVWRLPIVWVYFILSQEELVRFIISVFMFRGRKWMNTIA